MGPIEIIRRRVRLTYDAVRARGWSRLSRRTEDALNAISFLFPVGEAFFCRSVAHYLPRITDPVLREQVERFIHQEANHSREHARSNAALRQANALGAELETVAKVLVWISRTIFLRATQLAITCALEHFTAILASRLLVMREFYKDSNDPAFAAMWLWHAAEEIEHKGVCHDVYEHLFGRGFWAWQHRCFAMGVVTVGVGTGVLIGFTVVKLRMAFRRRPAAAPAAGAGAKRSGPSLGKLFRGVPFRAYTTYFRRDFHPWDQDDRPLLEAWKRDFPDFGLPDPHTHAATAA